MALDDISICDSEENYQSYTSIPYGLQLLAQYFHASKHCDIQDIIHNVKTNEYVLLDSRGISSWTSNFLSGKVKRLLDFEKYKFNTLRSLLYSRHYNVYFALTKEYNLKVFNLNFHEISSVECDGSSISKLLFNTDLNELITVCRNKLRFWKYSIPDKDNTSQGLTLVKEIQVAESLLVSNAEFDNELQRIYLLCDNDIWCYRTNGRCVFHLKSQGTTYFSVCTFSKEANLVIAGAINGQLNIYSQSGGLVTTLSNHSRIVTAVAVHPRDGYMFISASMDGTIKLFSLQILGELSSINVFSDGVYWMNIRSNNILYCSSRKCMHLYDLNYTFCFWSAIRSPVKKMDIVPKQSNMKSYVMVNATDNSIRLYSKGTGRRRCTILPPPEVSVNSDVISVAFDRGGRVMYVLFAPTELWIYSTRTDPATRVATWNIEQSIRTLLSTEKEESENLFDTENEFGISSVRQKEADENIRCCCLDTIHRDTYAQDVQANGLVRFGFLLCGLSNGTIALLDPCNNGNAFKSLKVHSYSPVIDIRVHYSDNLSHLTTLVNTITHRLVKIWNASTFECFYQIEIPDSISVFCYKNFLFIAGETTGRLHFESVEENKHSSLVSTTDVAAGDNANMKDHNGEILNIDILEIKNIIVSCGADYFIRIWNAYKVLLTEIKLEESLQSALFLKNDGTLLISFKLHLFVIPNFITFPEMINSSPLSDSSGSESIIYEDPNVKKEYRSSVKTTLNITLANYLVPYPNLGLESLWMFEKAIADHESSLQEYEHGNDSDDSMDSFQSFASTAIYQDSIASDISFSKFCSETNFPRCSSTPSFETFEDKEAPIVTVIAESINDAPASDENSYEKPKTIKQESKEMVKTGSSFESPHDHVPNQKPISHLSYSSNIPGSVISRKQNGSNNNSGLFLKLNKRKQEKEKRQNRQEKVKNLKKMKPVKKVKKSRDIIKSTLPVVDKPKPKQSSLRGNTNRENQENISEKNQLTKLQTRSNKPKVVVNNQLKAKAVSSTSLLSLSSASLLSTAATANGQSNFSAHHNTLAAMIMGKSKREISSSYQDVMKKLTKDDKHSSTRTMLTSDSSVDINANKIVVPESLSNIQTIILEKDRCGIQQLKEESRSGTFQPNYKETDPESEKSASTITVFPTKQNREVDKNGMNDEIYNESRHSDQLFIPKKSSDNSRRTVGPIHVPSAESVHDVIEFTYGVSKNYATKIQENPHEKSLNETDVFPQEGRRQKSPKSIIRKHFMKKSQRKYIGDTIETTQNDDVTSIILNLSNKHKQLELEKLKKTKLSEVKKTVDFDISSVNQTESQGSRNNSITSIKDINKISNFNSRLINKDHVRKSSLYTSSVSSLDGASVKSVENSSDKTKSPIAFELLNKEQRRVKQYEQSDGIFTINSIKSLDDSNTSKDDLDTTSQTSIASDSDQRRRVMSFILGVFKNPKNTRQLVITKHNQMSRESNCTEIKMKQNLHLKLDNDNNRKSRIIDYNNNDNDGDDDNSDLDITCDEGEHMENRISVGFTDNEDSNRSSSQSPYFIAPRDSSLFRPVGNINVCRRSHYETDNESVNHGSNNNSALFLKLNKHKREKAKRQNRQEKVKIKRIMSAPSSGYYTASPDTFWNSHSFARSALSSSVRCQKRLTIKRNLLEIENFSNISLDQVPLPNNSEQVYYNYAVSVKGSTHGDCRHSHRKKEKEDKIRNLEHKLSGQPFRYHTSKTTEDIERDRQTLLFLKGNEGLVIKPPRTAASIPNRSQYKLDNCSKSSPKFLNTFGSELSSLP